MTDNAHANHINTCTNISAVISNAETYRLLLVVFFCSLIALVPAWINYDIISFDGAFQYVPTASLYYYGKFHDALLRPQLPLFPLLIAGVSKISGLGFETSGRLISATGFVLASIGMFNLSRIIFKDNLIALISVLFFVTNRKIIDSSVDCLKESLLICFIVWGNYLILKGLSESPRMIRLIAGSLILVIGGAFIRSTAMIFFAAWLLIWIFYKKKYFYWRLLVPLIPLLGVIILWHYYPSLPIFKKSLNIDYLVYFYSVCDLKKIVYSSFDIISSFFSAGNAMVVLMGCLGFYLYKKDIYSIHLSIVFLISYLILVVWGCLSKRYLLSFIVWIFPLSAYVTSIFFGSNSRFKRIVAVFALITAPILWADFAFTAPDAGKIARRDAGKWILTLAGPGKDIISNRQRLVFYAQGKYIPVSELSGVNTAHKIIAIDIEHDGDERLIAKINDMEIKPDKKFQNIVIYLPKP